MHQPKPSLRDTCRTSLFVSSSSSGVLTPDQFPTTGLGNLWEHVLTFQTLFDALLQTFSIQDYWSLRSSLSPHLEVPRVPRWVNTFQTRSTLLSCYSSLVSWLQYTFSRVDGWMVAQGMKYSFLSFLGREIICTWRSSNTVLPYSFPSYRRVVTCILQSASPEFATSLEWDVSRVLCFVPKFESRPTLFPCSSTLVGWPEKSYQSEWMTHRLFLVLDDKPSVNEDHPRRVLWDWIHEPSDMCSAVLWDRKQWAKWTLLSQSCCSLNEHLTLIFLISSMSLLNDS
jgi:hypothetical protein